MVDLVLYAAPVFILCLLLEAASYRYLPDDDERGYEMRDSAASLSMGVGSIFADGATKLAAVAVFAAAYTISPYQLSADSWWVWVALFFADDLCYYLFHRAHHEIRVFWASHVVHHSSQYFNFSTALRQSWTPMSIYPFWLPMAFFFPPWMILLQQSVSLVYQFFLHTERIGTLWRPVELVMNTPSHHRVHHGSNDIYLDRNFGGILIIWDRLFGSFEPEGERVRYGLTRNIDTHHPVTIAFHEFRDLFRDLRRAGSWRTRLNHLVRGPEWTPDGRPPATGRA